MERWSHVRFWPKAEIGDFQKASGVNWCDKNPTALTWINALLLCVIDNRIATKAF